MKRLVFSAVSQKIDLNKVKREIAGKGVLLVLTGVLLAGMVCGALSARSADEELLSKMDFLFYSNFQMKAQQAMLSVFAASLTSTFLFLLADFLMGMSIWGAAFLPIVPFFRGLGMGLSSGYLYAAYSWKGVLFHLAVMLPGMVLSSVAILLSAKEGMRFSKDLTGACFSCGRGRGASPVFHDYLLRNGMILAIGAVAALFDMMLTTLLAGVIL